MNKTPISILQELMVQRKEAPPDYIFINSDNPELPFKCTVKLSKISAFGYATTKKEAKQNSAQNALGMLGLDFKYDTDHKTPSPQRTLTVAKHTNIPIANYVGQLNEMASMNGKHYPEYSEVNMPINESFIVSCSFLKWRSEGSGSTKKLAKQDAAKNMLDIVKDEKNYFDTFTIIKDEKQENIDRFTAEIVKRLEQLTFSTGSISTTEKIQATPIITPHISTLDELRKELEGNGTFTEIEIYQRQPYIVCLKIKKSDYVIMGLGNTKEDALKDLFNIAYIMFSYAFSF